MGYLKRKKPLRLPSVQKRPDPSQTSLISNTRTEHLRTHGAWGNSSDQSRPRWLPSWSLHTRETSDLSKTNKCNVEYSRRGCAVGIKKGGGGQVGRTGIDILNWVVKEGPLRGNI